MLHPSAENSLLDYITMDELAGEVAGVSDDNSHKGDAMDI